MRSGQNFALALLFVLLVAFSYAQEGDVSAKPVESLQDTVTRIAGGSDGRLVVAFCNYGYRLFAANMVLSLRHVQVENILVIALDEAAMKFFVRHGIETFFDPTLSSAGPAQVHLSPEFRTIMEIRLEYLQKILAMGVDVLFTDVDAVFLGEPFHRFNSGKQVEFAYDTPFLPRKGVKSSPLMVMAGFFFMRNCIQHPSNCDLLAETLEYQFRHPDKHDQFCLNQVLYDRNNIDYAILDPLLFTNGVLFFSDRAPQMAGRKPVAVQNNWITGAQNKVHRFREHLLWYLDPPSYYENETRRYLAYDNTQDAALGVHMEISALRNALSIAHTLNRTLILPLFCVYRDDDALYSGSGDWCTVEEYLQLDPSKLPMREHSFLVNHKTPQAIKNAYQGAKLMQIVLPSDKLEHERVPLAGVVNLFASSDKGATEREILEWLGPMESSVVLRLGSLDYQYQGPEIGSESRNEIDNMLNSGITIREEIARHAQILRDGPDPSLNFSCIQTWGGPPLRSLATSINDVIDHAKEIIPSEHHVFVSMDNLEAKDLDFFRLVWADATGFELFPWINQGFRRHQHTALITTLVCRHADMVVVDRDSEPANLLCQERIRKGKHCAEILGRELKPVLPFSDWS